MSPCWDPVVTSELAALPGTANLTEGWIGNVTARVTPLKGTFRLIPTPRWPRGIREGAKSRLGREGGAGKGGWLLQLVPVPCPCPLSLSPVPCPQRSGTVPVRPSPSPSPRPFTALHHLGTNPVPSPSCCPCPLSITLLLSLFHSIPLPLSLPSPPSLPHGLCPFSITPPLSLSPPHHPPTLPAFPPPSHINLSEPFQPWAVSVARGWLCPCHPPHTNSIHQAQPGGISSGKGRSWA